MSRREIFQNNTSDTLSASCTSGATTITVTTGSKFPSSGDFHVLVDTEIMLVTGRSTNTLTVTRGQEGTTAAAHSNAAVIALILTAASIKAYLRDNVPGADGSKPAMRLVDSTGAPLTSSDFTTINLDTSTITDQDGGIVLKKPGNAVVGENVTVLTRAYIAPATLIAGLRLCLPRDRSSGFPLGLVGARDSSGKMVFNHVLNDGGTHYQAARYNSPTSQNSLVFASQSLVMPSDVTWFKVEDDNATLKFSISHDGVNFVQMYSESRGAFLSSPSQFIWGNNNYGNNVDCLVSLVAWIEG